MKEDGSPVGTEQSGQSVHSGSGERWNQVWIALATLTVLGAIIAGLFAALWLASFFLYASLRCNPFHAGMWVWLDAARAWHAGALPKEGRRLAGSALFGVLLAYGGPGAAAYALWDHSGQRRLYGSARFASDVEIREAGLL